MAMKKLNIDRKNAQSLNLFRASLISLTKEIVKQVNSVHYNFIWNSGKDKIKRLILISNYKNGGLRMPHIETLIKIQRIMCMKKYLDRKNLFETISMCINGKLLFRKKVRKKGFLTVCDILSDEGKLKS